MNFFCYVCERDVGTKPKIIDGQPMRTISECRVRFGHFGTSFISLAMYKSALTKIITMSGSAFQA